MKPKRNKKIRTFVYFVQLRGELNHASLKPYLPNDPHKSLKCPKFKEEAIQSIDPEMDGLGNDQNVSRLIQAAAEPRGWQG
jgi:hypothetical protein